ncbi:putative amino acid transporter [Corynespora cassiicola Philippines]|uniref:Putative amino acid transporter n=1 Tax=Corynespora cassiicola Philippines TaxID=1448308 RepID=A0A2T2P496_CORCC|nr:putative amino acid transporter [Corynespora cassiicola Philippines]
MQDKKQYDEEYANPPYPGAADDAATIENDAVFGEITDEGPNYRAVGWLGTVAIMMKAQVGLGVLSIPAAFDTLGMIPGVITLTLIGIITSWSGYMVGEFKLKHRDVYGIEDVGQKLFGAVGREVLGFAFSLFWIACSGSGMLGISIALNSLSTHGACTAIFVAVAAFIGFVFSSIRTLGKITWLAWVGLVSIITAILCLTVAVGVQDRPAAAPQGGVWQSDYKLFTTPTFPDAAAALSSMILAFAGTPAYFNIAAEMRDPHHYNRALLTAQTGIYVIYITIGVVVYYFCGSYVASPALGSAGVTMKKVNYGIALPGLIVSTLLLAHFPAKYIFVRALRGSKHLSANTWIHWASWLGCTGAVCLIAYIIASAVPVFSGLVSLIGALFGTLICFQPMGCMWLYDNWSEGLARKSPRWMAMVCWSVFVVASGTFLMIAGTYGSIVFIINDYNAKGGSAAWSCADNSNSV